MHKFPALLIGALSAMMLSAAMAAGAPGAGTGMSASSAAANPNQEISTALQHAGMSAGSSALADVHMHLQHVINCLVGPSGKGYDAKAADPCKGQGTGALNDVGDMSKQRMALEMALKTADKGLAQKELKLAQQEAKEVMKELQDAQKAK